MFESKTDYMALVIQGKIAFFLYFLIVKVFVTLADFRKPKPLYQHELEQTTAAFSGNKETAFFRGT